MKYRIKYYYGTGDSFGTEDTSSIFEDEWENLEIAKANLKRIKEHYDFYKIAPKIGSHYEKFFSEKEIKIAKEAPLKDWYVSSLRHEIPLLKFSSDNGKFYQLFAPWCGYFEHLFSAEIIISDKDLKIEIDKDLKIEIDYY